MRHTRRRWAEYALVVAPIQTHVERQSTPMATISRIVPSSWSCRRVRSRSAPDARRRPTTIRISGSRRSRASARSPGSRRRTRATLARFGGAPFAARPRHAQGDPRPARQHPLRHPPRRQAVQSLAGRRASARAVADDHARKLPQRRRPTGTFCSISTRWPRRKARTGSWSGAATLPGTHDRAILGLSRGGGDAVVLREFDLATRDFVPDGFHLAGGQRRRRLARPRQRAAAVGAGRRTWRPRSGYARTVRLWRRGTDPLAGPGHLRERQRTRMAAVAGVDRDAADERLWFVDKLGFLRPCGLDRRPQRAEDAARPPDATSGSTWRSRLARGQAAHRLDGRRRDLRRRHPAGHLASTPSWPATATSRCCSSPGERRALQRLLLVRRPAGAVDPRRPQAGVRGAHARPPAAGRANARRPARSIGVADVWPLDVEPEETQRRPAGQRAGPADAALAVADRARHGAGRAQAGAAPLRRRRARGHPARGGVDRRRAHPLRAGRPGRPRPATRRCISTGYGGFEHRDAALLQRGARQALARARRHQRHRQHPRRRRVRHRLARGRRAAKASGCRTTTSRRSPPTWCAAA